MREPVAVGPPDPPTIGWLRCAAPNFVTLNSMAQSGRVFASFCVLGERAMKIHAFVLAFGGLLGATVAAHAQKTQDVKFPNAPPTELPPGPVENLQNVFGQIAKAAFDAPNPIIDTPAARAPGAPGPALGKALDTSMRIPGDIFAAPYAAVDPNGEVPAQSTPAKPAPRHHRHARGYHHPTPGTAG